MADKKTNNNQPKPLVKKTHTFSAGQIKDKPLIDKTSVLPPPATKSKK